MLRDQAFRVLANFVTAMESIAHNKHLDNSYFQAVLDSFLVFPPQQEILELTVDIEGEKRTIPHQVYHRESMVPIMGRGLHLIVDERQKKTIESEMTNRYLSTSRSASEIGEKDDTFAMNFVIANDNFHARETVEERLRVAEALRDAWITHIKSIYEPRGFTVWVFTEQSDLEYGNVRGYLKTKHAGRSFHDSLGLAGKPSSMGKRIIREQLRIHIEGNGIHQVCEFDIYPFEDMKSADLKKLTKSGLWDFRMKLEDDATGRYVANRIYERNLKRPIAPSLYELLWPPHLYSWLISRIMKEQIKPRMKRGWPFGGSKQKESG